MKSLTTKRIYEPASKKDGYRVLVDRLWPRGVAKAKANVDLWAKEATPTDELRKWFHTDPEKRYSDFVKKFKEELKSNPAAKELRAELRKRKGAVTILTAAKDVEHSQMPTLTQFLKR